MISKKTSVMTTKMLTKQHIALIFSLYITQYLGLAFFMEGLIAILRKNGASLENLGFIYMLGLFWVFRFLWSPFIDTIKFKKWGHYRGWIIIFQSLMVATLVIVSFFDLLTHYEVVITCCAFFAFFSASQNVALDALVFKTVDKSQRATSSALKISGGIIAMILGGGLGLVIYTHIGWEYTLQILAAVTAISLIQILFYQEAPDEEQGKKIETKVDFKQYIDFWKTKKRKKWLLLLLVYPITISSAYALITPLLVDLGWDLAKIGFVVHIVGYGIGVLASFGSSWVIKKIGTKNALVLAAIGQSIGALLLLLILNGYDSNALVMFVIAFIFTFYTPSSVIIVTLMMDQVSKKSPASQFAIQHSLHMFAGILFSGLSISLAGIIGYSNVILICCSIGVWAVYLSTKINEILD